MSKLRVLLTGASGAIGSEVARLLLEHQNQYELTFFDLDKRSVRRKLNKYQGLANLVYGDIRDRATLEIACHNQDVVLHLAAMLPPTAYDKPQEAKATNADGTKFLIECLEKESPGSFLIYTSSIAVYGDRLHDFWISVDDELLAAPGDVYAETKIAAEKHLRESKLNWSILRLTAIMGNHKPSRLMFYQPLATKMEIATITDTAKALVSAIDAQDQLLSKTFNLGGGATCRVQYDEFIDKSFSVMGLGQANFPEKAFADKNFHCGYYRDSGELENILHFQSDSLDDYLQKEAKKISPLAKLFLPLVRGLVKRWLLTLSEPYRAWKARDMEEMKKFYNF